MTFGAQKATRAMMLDQPVMPVHARGMIRNPAGAVALNADPKRHRPTMAIERYRQVSINPAYVDRELHNAAAMLKRMVRQGSEQSLEEKSRRTAS